MATALTDLRSEVARILPWLVPAVSTFSALGTTAYGVDTVLWRDPSTMALSAGSLNNLWIYRPAATDATDRERRALGNSGSPLDPTTGRIYADGAWTNAPASTERYELWAVQPRVGFNLLVETMENFLQADTQSIPMFTDADMEQSGTTSYSISGAGAISKVTAAANVLNGAQSLFFNAGTAGEYIETPSVRVQASQQYFAAVDMRVDVGGPAYLAVWDKTNDAEIESSNRRGTSLEAFMNVQRTFTIPATCEEIALRVYCTTDSDDIYIDAFHGPFKASDVILPVPTGLVRESDLRKLMVARYGLEISEGVYDARTRRLDALRNAQFHTRINLHHATQSTIELRDTRLPLAPLFAETLRKGADVTTWAFTAAGESAPTTNLPKRMLALEWALRLCRHIEGQPTLFNYAIDMTKVSAARASLEAPGGELAGLKRDYARDLETPTYPVAHPLSGRSLSGV